MTDFHTHILPKMDDGSSSMRMSVQMLNAESRQGIDRLVLTPHFYARSESPEKFLRRRERAVELLRTAYDPSVHPTLHIGAEVAYFGGLSGISRLDRLCIAGTNVLLIEMPFKKWSEVVVEDVLHIRDMGYVPVVAHYERYAQSRELFSFLLGEGVVFQTNAEHFASGYFSNRKALHAVKNRELQLLGSDCHNMSSRAPNMADTMDLIRRKLGDDALYEMEDMADRLLDGAVRLTPSEIGTEPVF